MNLIITSLFAILSMCATNVSASANNDTPATEPTTIITTTKTTKNEQNPFAKSLTWCKENKALTAFSVVNAVSLLIVVTGLCKASEQERAVVGRVFLPWGRSSKKVEPNTPPKVADKQEESPVEEDASYDTA